MAALNAADYLIAGTPFATAAGGLAWRRFAPASFWYGVSFPIKATKVYRGWKDVAAGCGLTRRRRTVRFNFPDSPLALVAGSATQRRGVRRVDVDKAPHLGLIRPTPLGFRVPVRLHDGQTPDTYSAALESLAHAWKVHAVRLHSWKPGQVTLLATIDDPLREVTIPDLAGDLLQVTIGVLETGEQWVIDFRVIPHWLNTGATNSGKSTLANGLIIGLAPQPVALVGFDLKGGVEFTPYEARMSALATEREDCADLLEDLLSILRRRMALCRRYKARNIWQDRIPPHERPTPIVAFVDEVAELFLMADKSEKEQIARNATLLLRIAQLGRAFGIYLVVCGQRVGSDLGPGVTALRSQLSGRICHRVNDEETAKMTLGDMDKRALVAARQIPAGMPGVAITVTADGRWHRARSGYYTEEQAEAAAHAYAHLAPKWGDLLAETLMPDAQVPDLDEVDPAEFDTTAA